MDKAKAESVARHVGRLVVLVEGGADHGRVSDAAQQFAGWLAAAEIESDDRAHLLALVLATDGLASLPPGHAAPGMVDAGLRRFAAILSEDYGDPALVLRRWKINEHVAALARWALRPALALLLVLVTTVGAAGQTPAPLDDATALSCTIPAPDGSEISFTLTDIPPRNGFGPIGPATYASGGRLGPSEVDLINSLGGIHWFEAVVSGTTMTTIYENLSVAYTRHLSAGDISPDILPGEGQAGDVGGPVHSCGASALVLRLILGDQPQAALHIEPAVFGVPVVGPVRSQRLFYLRLIFGHQPIQ